MHDRPSILAALAAICTFSAVAWAGGENDLASGTAPASQPARSGSTSTSGIWNGCTNEAALAADGSISPSIEPAALFEKLVNRYKGLHFYRDTSRLVQITSREGQEPSRVETEIGCEVRDGALTVKTPAAQARSSLGLDLPVRQSPAAATAQRHYDLWLAPHMSLKFEEQPLKDFRRGVDEGFTATEAERITIDNRDMLHMELRSGDGLSEDCTARFDLFINPETMLVERIDGEQRLPDGGSCTTSLQITPQDFEAEPAQQQ